MQNTPFNLMDIVPQEASFSVSGLPGKTLTLCKWSLRIRSWATTKYGDNGLQEIFAKQKIQEIAHMAWFMLKEKELFPKGEDDFLDAISSMQDQVNVIKALLRTVGIGEPEIEKIQASIEAAGAKPEAAPDPNG